MSLRNHLNYMHTLSMHMLSLRNTLLMTATSALLIGCGSLSFNTMPEGGVSKNRQPSQSLAVPPDLISTTSEEITSAQAEQQALADQEVLPQAYVTAMKVEGDKRWLEIDARPEQVWTRVLEFWESLGIGLVVVQPQVGTMETGWIAPERRPGAVAALFAGLNDSGYDKYTIRLERLDDDKTKLFVSHRWTQKILVVYPIKDAEATWVESEDPDKELELLKAVAFEMDPSNLLGG